MQFRLEQFLVGQLCLILGNQRRGERAAEGVFHDLSVFAGAQQHANGRLFVSFFHVSIQRLQVETQLTQILRLETPHLQFDGDQTIQAAMEKQQV